MKLVISAKRWDKPIVIDAKKIVIEEITSGTAHSRVKVSVDDEAPMGFELSEFDEQIEVTN